jgi:NADPH2:quinone reductase
MRALVCNEYGPPESLRIEHRADPEPAAGEVLVKIKAAGINFPDVLSIAGNYQVKTPLPFVPGNEAAGLVESIGEGVTRFQAGDRVIITPPGGGFAEKSAVSESLCLPLPQGLSYEQGAGFTITYATTYHAFCQSTELKTGETLLVLGAAGGVGIAAVELGRAMGATVIAAASSDEKLAFAKQAGADQLINYSDISLKETVKSLTGGKGVDVVYDPVGGELAEQAYRALAWHGRYLVIGFASGEIPKFSINISLLKEASIIGVWWGTWASRNPADAMQNMRALTDLVKQGKLNPRVTERYQLDDYLDAFSSITKRRARGKVILTMGNGSS